MQHVSTIESLEQRPQTSTADDPAAREAHAWLTRRLCWERRLAELRAAYTRAGAVAC